MNHLIWGNPLIQRYRFSLMKPKQFRIYLSVYIMVALLLIFINVKTKAPADAIFTELMVFQLILLWAGAVLNTGSAIKDEISNNTYDFFRLLPLSAHQKSIGIMIGKNLIVLLFVTINFLFLVWYALQIFDFLQLAQVMLLLLCGTFCLSTISLMFSIRTTSQKQKLGNAVIIICMILASSSFLGSLEYLHNSQWARGVLIPWFGWKIPWMLLIASVMSYLGGWAYAGSIRKFTQENQCLFTRPGAIVFLLGCELILLGLLLPHLNGRLAPGLCYGFWAASLVTILAICFGSIRTFDAYWDKSQMLMGLTKSGFMRKMCLYSNLALALLLFLIWAIFSYIAAVKVDMDLLETTGIIAILFLSFMFLILLIELRALYRPDSEKIGVLLAALAIFYFILPIICAAIFESEILVTGSPFGLFGYLIVDGEVLPRNWVMGLLGYHLLLCTIPAIKVTHQWANIRKVRSRIEKE